MNQLDAFKTNGSSPPRSRFPGLFPGETGPDFLVSNHGSIFLLQPLTPAGEEWVDEHVAFESYQWIGGALAVEHRYIRDIVAGIQGDGLKVRS